jgi:DMSO/TMAO reductase YedYZ molybdopterin-dependent catalytic subunit
MNTLLKSWVRRVPNIIAGLIAGLLAAAVMTLVMAMSRYWLGIMPPPEAVPDRIAPTLDIATFFRLFGKYGGYDGLKQFGITSGLKGIAATGATVGVLYSIIVEAVPSRRSERRMFGASRSSFLFLLGASLAAWIGLVVFLWPVLTANYRGVPYTWARILTIAALFAWIALFSLTLFATYHWITRRMVVVGAEPEASTVPPVARVLPRRSIVAIAVGAALTWPIYRILRSMYYDATFFYDGRQYAGVDIEPITPNDRFYSVTKNVVDPDVDRDLWRLEIGGHVRDAQSFSFDDLMDFEQVDQETTLCCISNRIGAGFISNANWKGVRLRDVLDRAGVRDGAYEVFVSGADAYHDSFSIDKAMEETTLVVYQMNGEPLPRIHGYPVRLIVPGLYGEKNVKWVSRIDVTTSDEKGFYEQQGWGPTFTPPTRSDIFTPRVWGGPKFFFRDKIQAGETVEVRGRAFTGDRRGIGSVEFTVDDGATWSPAEIYYPGTDLTWSLWRFEWTPARPGEYMVYTRAVDGTGTSQPGDDRYYIPDGAGGYPRVKATVV